MLHALQFCPLVFTALHDRVSLEARALSLKLPTIRATVVLAVNFVTLHAKYSAYTHSNPCAMASLVTGNQL